MNRSEAKFNNISIKMNDALISLLDSKEFNDISISEVCNVAKVNRSTFYSHYANMGELLNETWERMQSTSLENIRKDIEDLNIKNLEDLSQEESIFISPKFLIPYLNFIKENKKLFLVFVNHSKLFDNYNSFDKLHNNIVRPIMTKHNVYNSTVSFYMSKYYVTGITSIITEWVKRDCIDDIMLICEIILLSVRPHNT